MTEFTVFKECVKPMPLEEAIGYYYLPIVGAGIGAGILLVYLYKKL